MKRKGMHAARATSPRLRRVLGVLRRARHGLTGLQLERSAAVRAVGTACSELRKCGYEIDCRYVGEGAFKGSRVYRYTLIGEPG